MFEGYVASLLNKYLGEFIEGIDQEQLRIGVWGGNVKLQNLQVRPSCLDFLHLPVDLKFGSVGTLSLKANWRHLGSEPVQIVLDKIYLCIHPRVNFDFDAEKEVKRAIEDQLDRLRSTESLRLAEEQNRVQKEDTKAGLGTALTDKIIDNIQITINQIHIRFENQMAPNSPVAFGIVLHSLTAQTTDKHWRPQFVVGQKAAFKLVQLDKFYSYFSLDASSPWSQPVSSPERMADVFSLVDYTKPNCLLYPLSGEVKLVRNKVKDASPLMRADAVLYSLSFQISDTQYNVALEQLSVLTTTQASISEKLDALKPKYRQGTVHERKRYIELYKRTLNSSWLQPLTDAEKIEKTDFEKTIEYDDISKFRYTAFLELRRQLPKGTAVTLREQTKKGIFSGFFKSSTKSPEVTLTEKEKEEIYAELDFDPDQELQIYEKDFVKLALNFTMRECKISLLDSKFSELVVGLSTDTSLSLCMYPESLKVGASLANLLVADYATQNTLFPTPIRSAKGVDSRPFITFDFEQNPLDGSADQKIDLRVQQLQIVFHRHLAMTIAEFFAPPQDANMDIVAEWGKKQLAPLIAAYTASVSDTLLKHSMNAVHIDVAAPLILLPADPTRSDSDLLVSDLGFFKLWSSLQTRETTNALLVKLGDLKKSEGGEQDFADDEKAKLYDRYHVSTSNVQVFMTTQQHWSQGSGATCSEDCKHYLLNPFDMMVNFGLTISPTLSWLPNFTMGGELPLLQMNVSQNIILRLLRLLDTFAIHAPDRVAATEPSPTIEVAGDQSAPKKRDMFSTLDPTEYLDEERLTGILGSNILANELLKTADTSGSGCVTVGELRAWHEERMIKIKDDKMFAASFTVRQIIFLLTDDSDQSRPAEVVKMQVDSIAMSMEKRVFNMDFRLNMDGFSVTDLKTDLKPEFSRIIDTEGLDSKQESGFVSLFYSSISEESPDFPGAPVVSTLDIQIGGLHVQLNPESVENMGKYFLLKMSPVFSRAEEVSPEARIREVEDTSQPRLEVSQQSQATGAALAARESQTKMLMNVTFARLRVALCSSNTLICDTTMYGFSLRVQQYPLSMATSLRIAGLDMWDRTPHACNFPSIIRRPSEQTEKDLLCLDIHTYSALEKEYPGYENFLKFDIQGLRFTFLNRFVMNLVQLGTTGPISRLLDSLNEEDSAEALISQGVEAYNQLSAAAQKQAAENSKVTKIEASLADIELIVPVHSKSEETFCARLDSITLTNSEKKDASDVAYQYFEITVSSFTVSPSDRTMQLIQVDESVLSLDLKSHLSETSVSLDLGDISLEICHSSYAHLMGVISGNLSEQPTLAQEGTHVTARRSSRGSRSVTSRSRIVAPAEASPATDSKLGAAVVLRKASIKLFDGDRTVDETALVAGEIQDFKVDVSVHGSDMSMLLTIAVMKLDDVSLAAATMKGRGVLPCYRGLLSFAGGKDEVATPPLQLQLNQSSSRLQVDFNLDQFIVSLSPVIFLLPAWCAIDSDENDVTVLSSAENFSKVADVPMTVPEEDEFEDPGTPGKDITVVANLGGASMHLICDPSALRTQHLVFEFAIGAQVQIAPSGAISATTDIRNLAISQQEMEIVGSSFARVPNSAYSQILPTRKFNVVFHQHVHGLVPGQGRLVLEMVADPFNFRFTYRGYATLLQGLEALTAATQTTTPETPPALQKRLETVDAQSLTDEIAAADDTYTDKATEVTRMPEMSIYVRMRGVSVTLVNDCMSYEVPFLRVNLEALNFKMNSFKNERSTMITAQLFASFFNQAIVEWEPLLEPWSFSVSATESVESLVPNGCKSLKISSCDPLELNFSYAMTTGVLDALSLLTMAASPQNSTEKKSLKPYRLENHTEVELAFQIFREDPVTLSLSPHQQPVVISAYSELGIHLGDPAEQDHCCYHVRITCQANPNWQPIETSISKVGSTIFPLGKSGQSVACTQQVVTGVKVFSVHSPLGLINNTKEALIISPKVASGTLRLCKDMLEAGERMWMPLMPDSAAIDLSLRPAICSSFELSTEAIISHPPPSTSPLRYVCSSPSLGNFGFVITPKTTDSKYTLYDIRSPVVLANLLPLGLGVKLIQRDGNSSKGNVVADETVGKGQEIQIHAASPTVDTFVSFSFPELGCPCSEMHVLDHKRAYQNQKEPTLTRVLVSGPDNTRIFLHLELIYTAGSFCISVFVPFWFFDLTPFGLSLSQDRVHTNPRPISTADAKENERTAAMFSYDQEASTGAGSVFLRSSMEPGKWTSRFSIDTIGAKEAVHIPQSESQSLSIGVHVHLLSGRFKRTKVVTFSPHYVLINNTSNTLLVRPNGVHDTQDQLIVKIEPGQRVPYYGFQAPRSSQVESKENDQLICFRRAGKEHEGYPWSGFVSIDKIGITHLNVRSKTSSESWFAKVDVRINSPGVFILLEEHSLESIKWQLPFRIDNNCLRQHLRFRQGGADSQWVELRPYTSAMYAWEQPTILKRLLEVQFERVGDTYLQQFLLPLHEVRNLACIPLKNSGSSRSKLHVYIYVRVDGPVLVLTFSDFPQLEVSRGSSRTTQSRVLREQLAQERKTLSLLEEAFEQNVTKSLQKLGEQAELAVKMGEYPEDANNKSNSIPLLTTCTSFNFFIMFAYSKQSNVFCTGTMRPKELLPSQDCIEVHVMNGRTSKGKDVYVKVEYGQYKLQTAVSTTHTWNEVLRIKLRPSEASASGIVRISMWEKNKLWSDDYLGGFDVPLKSLENHEPVEEKFQSKQAGGCYLNLKLWWVGMNFLLDDDRLARIQRKVQEDQRMLKIIQRKLRGLRMSDSGPQFYKSAPAFEYVLTIAGVSGISELHGIDLSTGTVLCHVSVPMIEYDASFMICEATTSSKGGAQASTNIAAGDIPAMVHHGNSLHTKGIYNGLKTYSITLAPNEKLVYHVCNAAGFVSDEVVNCCLLTSERLIGVKNGIPSAFSRADILHVQHIKNGHFRWDILKISTRSGPGGEVGVYSEKACRFLASVLQEAISPAAHAEYQRRQRGSSDHSREENPLIALTIAAWGRTSHFFVPEPLLKEHQDSVRDDMDLTLVYCPKNGNPSKQIATVKVPLSSVSVLSREDTDATKSSLAKRRLSNNKWVLMEPCGHFSAPSICFNLQRYEAPLSTNEPLRDLISTFPALASR